MGTWGPGEFENDYALKLYSVAIAALAKEFEFGVGGASGEDGSDRPVPQLRARKADLAKLPKKKDAKRK